VERKKGGNLLFRRLGGSDTSSNRKLNTKDNNHRLKLELECVSIEENLNRLTALKTRQEQKIIVASNNDTTTICTTNADRFLTLQIDMCDIELLCCLSSKNKDQKSIIPFGTSVWSCCIGSGLECVVKMTDKTNVSEQDICGLRREIAVLSMLEKHPNIVRFIAQWETETHLYLFIRKYNAGTVRDALDNKHKKISNIRRQKWAICVAEGLLFLHENSVIHRDIKATNIFLNCTDEDHVVIGDFDVSKFIVTRSPHVRPHSRVGTPAWMAPEMLCEKKARYGLESDIWALGMFFYELITRKIPYYDVPPFQLHEAIRDGDLPSLTGPKEMVDHLTLYIAHKECCKTNPEQRPNITDILKLLSEKKSTAEVA